MRGAAGAAGQRAQLLITDAEDSLSWDRAQHRGWGVGLYPPESEYDGECLTFGSTEDGRLSALATLVDEVLAAFVARQRQRSAGGGEGTA